MTQSSDTPNQELTTVDSPVITRTNLGQFIKGVSGNPNGREVGSKNRTKVIKQAMEEALTRGLGEAFDDIIEHIVALAREGDKDMIKLVISDIMKEVRKDPSENEHDGGPKVVNVKITQYFGETEPVKEAIDAEFTTFDENITGEPKNG